MKVKELIRLLKDYSEDATVIFGDDARIGDMIYMKAPESFSRGDLKVQDSPIGPFIQFKQDKKGKFLLIDLKDSGFYTIDDFQK